MKLIEAQQNRISLVMCSLSLRLKFPWFLHVQLSALLFSFHFLGMTPFCALVSRRSILSTLVLMVFQGHQWQNLGLHCMSVVLAAKLPMHLAWTCSTASIIYFRRRILFFPFKSQIQACLFFSKCYVNDAIICFLLCKDICTLFSY